jgi:hypothetical protein
VSSYALVLRFCHERVDPATIALHAAQRGLQEDNRKRKAVTENVRKWQDPPAAILIFHSVFQLTKWRNVDATDPGTPATVSRKTMRVNAFFSVSLPNE